MKNIKASAFQSNILVMLLSACVLNACGGGGGGSASSDQSTAGTFMSSLQTWPEFAPKSLPVEDEGVEVVDAATQPTVQELTDSNNKTKVCTTEKVSFYNTPDEYVMFAPPTNILYPGALIVGKSLRDGASPGELLPINVAQRNPIDVTIAACLLPNNGNTRRVQPTLAAVNGAVADIIAEAAAANIDCTNAQGTHHVETYRNEAQRALKAGMSGRYFGFSGKASGSYNKTEVENSVAAVFRETLYTVDISAPQSPGEWFSSAFTPNLLQQQIDQGTMDVDNIPVYVSRVTYGRMLTSTATSTYSEADMRAALEFKFNHPAGSVSGDLAVRSKTIREASSMTVAYLGGSAVATAAMLKSDDWTQYIEVPVTAGDAVPISFELRSTRDNVPAAVQELTEYDRVTCIDKLGDNATFAMQNEQQFTPGFSSPASTVATGDINGDGADDIVWAATGNGARGEFAVALANGDGTFAPAIMGEHTGVNNKTGEFDVLVTDVDSDGRDDIVFNVRQSLTGNNYNTAFVAFYKDSAGPGFIYSAEQALSSATGWQSYRVYKGQMDGLRGSDLVWNNTPVSTSINRTYFAYAVDTTTPGFDLESDALFALSTYFDHPAQNFSGYEYTHVADFNGDGKDDLIWQNIDANGNGIYTGLNTGTGLDFRPYQYYPTSYAKYVSLAGDATGDGAADLIEPRSKVDFANFGIYVGEGSGVSAGKGGLAISPHAYKSRNRDPEDIAIQGLLDSTKTPPDVLLADVNGDGGKDLILNDKGYHDSLTNQVGVGLSVVGGAEFTFVRVAQEVGPQKDWSQYHALIGDVTGDGRDDILWILNGVTNSIYVGVARGL